METYKVVWTDVVYKTFSIEIEAKNAEDAKQIWLHNSYAPEKVSLDSENTLDTLKMNITFITKNN